jgi:glycosyltransferase involved in cell wall biosynthesis
MALLSADHIVVLTERHKEVIRSLSYMVKKDDKVSVIPCCVDMSRFTPLAEDLRKETAKRAGLPGGFILLYLGSLGTCYFLDEMLGFFKKLKERDPEAAFLFLTNYDAKEIAARAQGAGLDKGSVRVMFAEPADVPRWVSLADAGIYFINAYKKFGSCPIKTGEYLASGLPMIINSGIGDSDSFIKGRRIGAVVESLDDGGYQRAIDRLFSLLNEPGIRERCRQAAEECLSLSYGLELYSGIYKSICRKMTG